MAYRFGFGDKTGETEKGGLSQYEDGHIDVSRDAFNHAVQEAPSLPPAAAVGWLLITEVADVAAEDLPTEVAEAEADD